MKPLVSVVLPLHNAQEYLNMTIDSVMAQSHGNFELLIVDCSSTDSSGSIVTNYQDQRIKYLKNKSQSIQEGRLAGIAAAKGQLVAMLAQDDICEPGRLEQQVKFLQANQTIQLAGANFELIDADSRVYDIDERKTKFLRQSPFAPGSAMFRTELKPEFLAGRLSLDDWWNNLEKINLTILPQVLYCRRLVRLEAPKSEDFLTWLAIGSAVPDAGSPLAATGSKRQRLESLISACNQTWERNQLTLGQKTLLENYSDQLQSDWSQAMDKLATPPKISIVMSMYNSEDYLRPAIESILKQTVSDYEFIIIDDGCVDRSIEIVRSYNDPRMRIIHQINHGLVFSFNKGVRLARADFIARMDADDIALPTRFKKELEWLQADNRRGMVSSFFQYIDGKTSKRMDTIMAYPYKHVDLLRSMYIVNPIGHGSVLMRKAAIQGVGGYRSKYEPAEDYDLWQRIARRWQIGLIPEVLYLWRFHPASISRRKQEASNAGAALTVSNMWAQPPVFKSALRIVRDASFYQRPKDKLSKLVYQQYLSQQERLAIDFLRRRKLLAGWHTALATIWLDHQSFKRLLRPLAASILKYNKGIK